jgi:transposase
MTSTPLKKGARLTGEQRTAVADQVVALYNHGFAIRDIADELGRSYGNVHRILKDAKVEFRSRGGAHGGSRALTHEQRREYLDRLRESTSRRRR